MVAVDGIDGDSIVEICFESLLVEVDGIDGGVVFALAI